VPVLSVFYIDDESWYFLGTCKFGEREAFQEKMNALCIVNEWDQKKFVWRHHYLGSCIQTYGFSA
jgi:hypothetical protein